MKTSEFIRYAIDTKLAGTYAERLDNGNKTQFLCLSFQRAYYEMYQSSIYEVGFPALHQILMDEVGEAGVLNLGRIQVEDDDFTAIRFMYAEFLALYFEDMGD